MAEVRTPRRQARGRRRMDEILAAAGRVFARDGFSRATTNAIAAEAGISPGSLYQFFSNKEQIAEALEARYVEAMGTAHAEQATDLAGLSLGDAVDRLIEPVVAYALATPGFGALFAERPMHPDLAESGRRLHVAIVGRVESILAASYPAMSDEDRGRRARIGIQMCRGVMPLIAAADERERDALVGELKRALVGYWSANSAP